MPARIARLRCLAKVNLDLRVLYKRPDGFHELRTLFQTISLADTLDVSFTPGRLTKITLESELDIPNNLILRAAELVLEAAKASGQLHFKLDKKIPMGGGLGGGSSNAAAVLLALPVLAGKTLPVATLVELGARLGSDVPFFLLGGTALGLGRGAELYPVPEPAARPALLVTPGVHVSTADAYRALNRSLTPEVPSDIMDFQSLAWRIGDRGQDHGWQAVNDFETVVFRQHPQLESIKGKLLKSGARPALMSGSGSTLFGIYNSHNERDRAVVRFRKELGGGNVHAVSLVGRSRYRALWWRQLRDYSGGKVWPPRSRYSR